MLKNITSIEVKRTKDEKELVYQLLCENHASLGELYDVLCEMRGYVLERLAAHHKAEASSCKKEEPKPEASEPDPEVEKPQDIIIQCPNEC